MLAYSLKENIIVTSKNNFIADQRIPEAQVDFRVIDAILR